MNIKILSKKRNKRQAEQERIKESEAEMGEEDFMMAEKDRKDLKEFGEVKGVDNTVAIIQDDQDEDEYCDGYI